MNENYCSYELSKALKAAGFDEPCQMYYTHEDAPDGAVWLTGDPRFPQDYNSLQDDCPFAKPICSAPHIYQAQKWLREKKKMHCQVLLNGVRSMYFWQVRELVGNGRYADSTSQYDVYEDAMGDCISAALELIKKGE